MEYRVYDPCPELAPFIRCFWSLDGEPEKTPVRQRIVPDGCMEMIFHYGDLYEQFFDDNSKIVQPRSFIFGQISRFIEIAPTGKTGIIAARFNPEGLSPFLNVPLNKLEGKAVELSIIFREGGKELESEILQAEDHKTKIKLIEQFLLLQLTSSTIIDRITQNCVDLILRSQGQISIEKIADTFKINRRNLERRFENRIGLSPKQLSRAIRLQQTLRMMENEQLQNLTSIAYENGYFDQAHFIKDFKEFTGMNPKSFYEGNLRFAAFFASEE